MGNILENEVLKEGIHIMSQTKNPMALKFSQKSIGDGESLIEIQLIDKSEIQQEILMPPQKMTIIRLKQLSTSLKFGSIICKFKQISDKTITFKECKRCKQKVQQRRNTYWCNQCKDYVDIQNKFFLKAKLIDETGTLDVTFFDENLGILEINADEWVKLSDAQKTNYLSKFDLNCDYQFLIQLKQKKENEFYFNVRNFYKLQ